MAFIPTPNGVKIEIKFNKNGALVVNIIWVRVSVSITTSLLSNLTAAVITWWDTHMQPLTNPSMSLIEVIATDMSVEDGVTYEDGLVTPLAGTDTGADLPSNIAFVVSFLTEQSGRSYRGRNYLAGISEPRVSGNTIQTIYVAAVLTAYAQLKLALSAEGADHCVASFQHNGAPRPAGVLTDIIEYRADNVVDTQRRRIPQVFS